MSFRVIPPAKTSYTTSDGTLQFVRYHRFCVELAIHPRNGAPISRLLDRYSTFDYLGKPVNSTEWQNHLSPRRLRKPLSMSPWAVWKNAKYDVSRFKVVAAVDGSGPWTLVPLSKGELKASKQRTEDKYERLRSEAIVERNVKREAALTLAGNTAGREVFGGDSKAQASEKGGSCTSSRDGLMSMATTKLSEKKKVTSTSRRGSMAS